MIMLLVLCWAAEGCVVGSRIRRTQGLQMERRRSSYPSVFKAAVSGSCGILGRVGGVGFWRGCLRCGLVPVDSLHRFVP